VQARGPGHGRRCRRITLTRRGFTGAAALALLSPLAACTEEAARIEPVAEPPTSAVLPDEDPAATALALSAALFTGAELVIIAPAEALDQLTDLAADAGVPLLLGPAEGLPAGLERLGARTVLAVTGHGLTENDTTAEIVELDLSAGAPELPEMQRVGDGAAVTLLVDPDVESPARPIAAALVGAAGGAVAEIPGGDVGRSSASVAALREAAGEDPAHGVLALGASFGPSDAFAATVQRTLDAPELPGGGTALFPGRRFIAAYGSPKVPSLGVLGEQDLPATLERVAALAGEYEGLAAEPVVPALEIIATIASSQAGGDGDYSSELGVEGLREWVDTAGEAGVYVVLDLQPGTTDFLTQARRYEELLTAPHVGLALDAEWRLEPGQKHLEQIGSVTAAEINEVSTWLADLTAEHALPQKLLILHQFTRSMIRDRQDLDTRRPELAITLHADGHGVPGDKLGTYRALQKDLPAGIHMAWKNFYDEDTPMFTPEETLAVEPTPWFISYQ